MSGACRVAAFLLLSGALAEQCRDGKRGPKCSKDSDCVNQGSCVRCAHSGHCTNEPLPGPSPTPGPGPHPDPHPAEGCTKGNKSYDFLALVQGWPKSACLSKSCHGNYAEIDYFTMHGLWPSRIGNMASSYPCTCDNRAFDESQVSSIMDQLKKYWPSFKGNAPFWAHEWTKHGTCSSSVSGLEDQLPFFKTTLGLRQSHDIGAALRKANITADSSVTYSGDEIRKALTPIAGFAPMLGCVNHGGKQYLHEVSFCLDKELKDVECDNSVRTLPHDEISDCDAVKPMVWAAPDARAGGTTVFV